MKNAKMLFAVLAMIALFVPIAYAADNAQLGLSVTFAPSEPLTLVTEPQKPTVQVGQETHFKLIANDPDATHVIYFERWTLPTWIEVDPIVDQIGHFEADIICRPQVGDIGAEPYPIKFVALPEGEPPVELTINLVQALFTEPRGPITAQVGQETHFKLIANDPDATHVIYFKSWTLPEWIEVDPIVNQIGHFEADVICTPRAGDVQPDPYRIEFVMVPEGEPDVELTVDIVVTAPAPLTLVTEPAMPGGGFVVKVGEKIKFQVIAEDKDSKAVKLGSAENLPEGAVYSEPMDPPWPPNHREGTFTWVPKVGQGDKTYDVHFFAMNAEHQQTELVALINVQLIPSELQVSANPPGPYTVKVGEILKFDVIAQDRPELVVKLTANNLPDGATFIITDGGEPFTDYNGNGVWDADIAEPFTDLNANGCYDMGEPFTDYDADGIYDASIAEPFVDLNGNGRYDAGTPNVKTGHFEWLAKKRPPVTPWIVYLEATACYPSGEPIQQIALEAPITVIVEPVISIELKPAEWKLEGIKLGAKITNGPEQHQLINTGNVAVMVDIKYGELPASAIQPGTGQGLDTFVTLVGSNVMVPGIPLQVCGSIVPGEEKYISLTYGAPTALSDPEAAGMAAAYELRAYNVEDK